MENNNKLNPVYIEKIARVCHQANKTYCETHGDYSQENWDKAHTWQKESAIQGVIYKLDNPDKTGEDQHNAWLREKEKAGWVYGEVKDAEKKTHPCMVPYHELPEFQRRKDALFVAIVNALK